MIDEMPFLEMCKAEGVAGWMGEAITFIAEIRQRARNRRDFKEADWIRGQLKNRFGLKIFDKAKLNA